MDDLEKAMAEFLASKTVTVCEPVLTAKQSLELAKAKRKADREKEEEDRRYEAIERNAENRRYDNEGVYYIGGKMVETKYGF